MIAAKNEKSNEGRESINSELIADEMNCEGNVGE
jgi:hypothetical protein